MGTSKSIKQKRKRIAAIVGYIILKRKINRKTRKVWTKPWIARRERYGVEQNLLKELETDDPVFFRNFLRMTKEDFEYILEKVSPLIVKQDTNMRKAVTPKTRLAVTLRYLATGKHCFHTKQVQRFLLFCFQ